MLGKRKIEEQSERYVDGTSIGTTSMEDTGVDVEIDTWLFGASILPVQSR